MEQLESLLQQSLAQLLQDTSIDSSSIPLALTIAPEHVQADFSSTLPLRLSKLLHRPPLEIAQDLQSIYNSIKSNSSPDISIAPPGFLNFISPDEYWLQQLHLISSEDSETFRKNISSDEYNHQIFLVEFSDPNPFKVLHVGHLYTSIVGDSIARLLESKSADVKRLNFGGDVGLHVAKNLYELRKHQDEITQLEAASAPLDEKAALMAKCYVAGTRAYEDDNQAHQDITALNRLIYKISSLTESHDYAANPLEDPAFSASEVKTLAELYWWGRKTSYAYFKQFYARIGLSFDRFYPESSVAELGKNTVLAHTPAVYTKSDGAIIFRGEDYGLHTRVFINQAGLPTYEAKDVGLLFQKDHDYHFDHSIVITDSEQKEYMRVVMKSIEQYAPDLIQKSTHLTHGMVKLPGSVKMSSRKGNFLKAIDVLDLIRQTLKSEYHSEDETIVLGAIKYAFLKSRLGGNLELDVKESVSMTGTSGPYLQYSAVRAKKILEKSHSTSVASISASPASPLTSYEKTLIKQLSTYPEILDSATKDFAPHKLATFLYESAQEFSRFYEHSPVIGSDSEAFRIQIVRAFFNVMSHGLELLGISIPNQM